MHYCWCRWAHLSSFSTMHHRWVVTGPYSSSLVGPFAIVGSWSGPTHRHWNVARPFIRSHSCRVVLLFIIGSSFLHSGIIHVAMVGVGWSCLIRCTSVGQNVGIEHMSEGWARKTWLTRIRRHFGWVIRVLELPQVHRQRTTCCPKPHFYTSVCRHKLRWMWHLSHHPRCIEKLQLLLLRQQLCPRLHENICFHDVPSGPPIAWVPP